MYVQAAVLIEAKNLKHNALLDKTEISGIDFRNGTSESITNVKFLRKPLQGNSEFLCWTPDQYSEIWSLLFFKGTKMERMFYVAIKKFFGKGFEKFNSDRTVDGIFGGLLAEYFGANWQVVSKNIFFTYDKDEELDSAVENCSIFLREASSLAADQYEKRSDRMMAVDGPGISLISNNESNKTSFRRIVLIEALARAYMHASESSVTLLSQNAHHYQEVSNLHRDISVLDAQLFFNIPVKIKNVRLYPAWLQIARRYKLSQLHEELLSEIMSVRGILEEDQRKSEERR